MGYRLRELREDKRMTQEELADKSGVTRQTIISIENDKSYNVTIGTLTKLADALETSVEQLLYVR